ncbi:MAG: LamG-like jellyroll fold domain-containing protein [Bacteroidota bacterium]
MRILIWGILCLLPSLTVAQFTLQDSLIAWYPFDGDALDYSGNDNHGTVNGPVLTTDRFGNANSAYQFDGVDDFIEYVNNQKFQPDFPITISVWVFKGDQDFNPVFLNNFRNDTYHGFWLNLPSSGTVSVAFGDGGPASPASRRSKIGTTTIALNQWYHVGAIIRGARDMDIYINGKRDCGNYSGTGGPINYFDGTGNSGHSDGLSQPNTGDFFFKGKIDELRFYNRALEKSEIRILADFPPQDSVLCLGESYQMDAGYGSLISWTPSNTLSCSNCSNPFATPNNSTIYSAITANTPGCLDTVVIDLAVDPCDSCELNLSILSQNNIDCFGNNNGSFSLSAVNGTGPYSYSLDGVNFSSNSVFSNLDGGDYTVFLLDADSCLYDTVISIIEPQLFELNPSVSHISCFGAVDGVITMNPLGGTAPYQYSLNGGALQAVSSFDNLPAGNYSINAIDANGCTTSSNITIIEPTPISLDSLQLQDPTCFNSNDGQVLGFASGGTSPYYWSINGGSLQANSLLNQLGTGNFTIKVEDSNMCADSSSFMLSSTPPILASFQTDSVRCVGETNGSIFINASGGVGTLSFAINNGAPQAASEFINLGSDSYQISIIDSLGCRIDSSISVPSPLPIQIFTERVIAPDCGTSNGSILVGASGGNGQSYQYDWITPFGLTGPEASGLAEGTYEVRATDLKGCEAVQEFELKTLIFPIAEFALSRPDTSTFILSEANVFLDNLSKNAVAYLWEWGDGSMSSARVPNHQYLSEGIYTIVLTAWDRSFNCFDTDSLTIEIIPDGSIFVPNAFSPNQDGSNDEFLVLGEGIVSLELVIYSRWGFEIYRQQGYPLSWDGTDEQNRAVPEGVYTYRLQARLNSRAVIDRAGTITLIR